MKKLFYIRISILNFSSILFALYGEEMEEDITTYASWKIDIRRPK